MGNKVGKPGGTHMEREDPDQLRTFCESESSIRAVSKMSPIQDTNVIVLNECSLWIMALALVYFTVL